MGPRVVPADRYAAYSAALHGKQQPVIGLRSACDKFVYLLITPSIVVRIQQRQPAPSVRIAGCRARSCSGETILSSLTVARNINGIVCLPQGPQVKSLASHITCGYEPVHPNLSLNAQVPHMPGH